MDDLLSKRGVATIASLDTPWRFVSGGTYHPVDNPSGLIVFASAQNMLVADEIADFTNDKVKLSHPDFQYTKNFGGGKRFTAALATHLNEYMTPHEPIKADDIRVVNGATSMHHILAWSLADPGDGFLVSRPVYGRFELDLGNMSGVKVVYADTTAETSFDEEVVDAFESALKSSNESGGKIKALAIVNPSNPLGKCYSRNTLVKIMKFCQKHRIHLFSDEIYACSVFDSGEADAVPYTSLLSIDPTGIIDPDYIHVEYGLSKDFGSSGLRVGAIITRSTPVLQAIDTTLRFYGTSGASLAIGTAMLEDRQWCRSFIESTREKLASAYKHVTAGLRDIGVEYLRGTNAGFFVWIDLSPYLPTEDNWNGEVNAEFALAKKLKDAGVFLHPREEHSSEPGWFRLVYTQDPAAVTEGIRRIHSAINT